MDTYISLGDSIIVTLFSVIMVFLVLIVILIFISMLKNIDKKEKSIDTKVDGDLNADKIKGQAFVKEDDKIDDEELIAVISAAIAASLDRENQEINIKSIRRLKDDSPAWTRAGRQEQVQNRV